jgi:hypothetical protein
MWRQFGMADVPLSATDVYSHEPESRSLIADQRVLDTKELQDIAGGPRAGRHGSVLVTITTVWMSVMMPPDLTSAAALITPSLKQKRTWSNNF